MSSRVSPGGALLRNSRMFSLPKAIPNAPADSGLARTPKLGTNTHPTQQAITTYDHNRKTGEWGLKRPLPLRTTLASSTPAVRIKQLDSCEMITDFHSAGEHTITLQKFQELNLPVTVPVLPNAFRGSSPENVSVFEEDCDFTARDQTDGQSDSTKRWKFSGPWLAGMKEGDFDLYIRKSVRPRRAEFRDFMKKRIAAELTAANQQAALETAENAVEVTPEDVTDAQFTTYIRKARAERFVLFSMVSDFLDLAPVSMPTPLASISSGSLGQGKPASTNAYAERGPPTTHPSAGISYLRTAAFAENHPIYGPQAQPAPTWSRIIVPRLGHNPAKVGVAGFISDAPQGDSTWNLRLNRFNGSKQRMPGTAYFDPKIPGGPKAYVQPRTATVSSQGQIMIKLDEADEVAQMITKELLGEAKIYNQPSTPAPVLGGHARSRSGAAASARVPPRRREKSYGLDA